LIIEIIYGSVLSFRSHAYGGGILHSHVQTYPEGSKQQQVFLHFFFKKRRLIYLTFFGIGYCLHSS